MNAVITGDLVHFTELVKEDKLQLLNDINASLKQWAKDYDMEYEFYRGDSFQCFLEHPHESLRLALIIKAYIKSLNNLEEGSVYRPATGKRTVLFTLMEFDSRISLGIADNNFRSESLATSNGDAFVLSGRNLDHLKDTKYKIGIATNDRNARELETGGVLIDHIISRATALQCEVIYLKLLGYNETDISKQLNVNQSAVNQRSTAAGWNAIHTFVERFEELYPR
jgi:hypothetical protein